MEHQSNERGFAAVLGIVMLSMMVLAGTGAVYTVKNLSAISRRYEIEYRLGAAAKNEVERVAVQLCPEGRWAGRTFSEDYEEISTGDRDGYSFKVMVRWDRTRNCLLLSSLVVYREEQPNALHLMSRDVHKRIHARMKKAEGGKIGYAWDSWSP